jgi:hypothetical protein
MILIELLVSDSIVRPSLQRESSKVRILLPTLISYEQIMESLGEELTTVQALELYDLWCNDALPRTFAKTTEGTIIAFKKHSAPQQARPTSRPSTIYRT